MSYLWRSQGYFPRAKNLDLSTHQGTVPSRQLRPLLRTREGRVRQHHPQAHGEAGHQADDAQAERLKNFPKNTGFVGVFFGSNKSLGDPEKIWGWGFWWILSVFVYIGQEKLDQTLLVRWTIASLMIIVYDDLEVAEVMVVPPRHHPIIQSWMTILVLKQAWWRADPVF